MRDSAEAFGKHLDEEFVETTGAVGTEKGATLYWA